MPKKKTALTIEERLQQALVPAEEQPYEVPENWVWVRLENVCEHMKAGGDKPKDFSAEKVEGKEIPVVANGIEDEGIIGYTSCSGELSGSLTVAGRGTIGYSFIRMYEFFPVVRLLVVRPYDFVNLKMLKYVFDAIPEKGKGSSIPQLTIPMIKEKAIPLPPLSEQQRIVERIEELFAKLDEAKERLQEVADSFAVRKAAILHKAFTGELTKQWRLENGVSDESWEEKLLGDVCTVNPKKIDAKNLDDNLEVSFVPMAAVSDVFGEIVNHEVKNLQDVRTGFTNFSEGDVIFAKITPCMENGKSAIVGPLVNDIGYGSTEFYVLRCKEELYNKYLYHMVRNTTFRAEAKAVMTGAVGQQRVPKTFLQEYQLLLPSLPEQHEIVRLIDDLLARERKAQQATEQALASIDLMKKSIFARVFRGELGTNKASEASALELLKQVLAED